jgi:FixJ family two-component response regulator
MTGRSVRILIASDRAEAIDRVRNELADATLAWSFHVTTASSLSDFWRRIAEAPPEVVILDSRFAPRRGLSILHSLGAQGMLVPLILLADSDVEPLAKEAVRAGAVECLPLDSLTHRALVSSIRYAVDIHRGERKAKNTEEALRKAEDQLREMVRHAGIMTCTHDLSGIILSIDEAASRALGSICSGPRFGIFSSPATDLISRGTSTRCAGLARRPVSWPSSRERERRGTGIIRTALFRTMRASRSCRRPRLT